MNGSQNGYIKMYCSVLQKKRPTVQVKEEWTERTEREGAVLWHFFFFSSILIAKDKCQKLWNKTQETNMNNPP